MRKSAKRRPYKQKTQVMADASAVFAPIEHVIAEIRRTGTIDAVGDTPVFCDNNKLHPLVPAIERVIQFHELALSRYGTPVDIAGMKHLVVSLKSWSGLDVAMLDEAEISIASCKRQAMALTMQQANEIIQTVRISIRMDQLKGTS